jgi:ribosomal protein S27E
MSYANIQHSSSQSQTTIACPKCGAHGECVWENEHGKPYLVSLPASFFERLKNRPPFNVEIVCQQCGTAQVELVPRPWR